MANEENKTMPEVDSEQTQTIGADATQAVDDVVGETAVMEPVQAQDTSGIDIGADGEPVAEGEAVDGQQEPADAEGEAPEGAEAAAVDETAKRKRRVLIAAGSLVAVAVVGAIAVGTVMQPAASGALASSSSASATAASASASSAASKSATTAASSASASAASGSAASAAASAKSSGAVSAAASDTGSASDNGGTSSGNDGGGAASGNDGGDNAGGGGGAASEPAGGNGGGGSAQQQSEPAHVHNWVPVTESVEVVVQPARTEYYDEVYTSDGRQFSDAASAEAYCEDVAIREGKSISTSYVTMSREIPAITETQEQVVGYRCSDCGATK